jgi:GT2 family glycosyltransferase
VSIIIVTFGGGWRWVPHALAALRRNTPEPYEVILVDNGGGFDGRALDQSVVAVRNERNVGFGPASNQGAARARGEVLCLLNPDTFVEPGWLAPLLERVHEPDVGAVFPAKLNLDRTMQEAGAFVTGEAHSYVFGDGEDPDAPEYAFPREVDYGSAAAACMTRSCFLAAGGFDPAYRLAYYEDTDLCFRLRQQELRLVYEPRSRVLHVGGISASSADRSGLSAANREVFLNRWETAVEQRPRWEQLRTDVRARLQARDFHARDRVLVLGADALAQRAARGLASAHPRARVTILAGEVEPSSRCFLHGSGVEVVETPRQELLRERVDHYSHVLSFGEIRPELRRAVRDTQPHALYVPAEDEAIAALSSRLALG